MVHTINGVKVYNGKVAQNICSYILTHSVEKNDRFGTYEEYQRPYVCGWFQEDNVWVAFDNSDGNMWVEQFDLEEHARIYAMCIIADPDVIREGNYRFCDECGKLMKSGYVIADGEEHYCSDECLHKHYTAEQWDEMYDNEGANYWTEWD